MSNWIFKAGLIGLSQVIFFGCDTVKSTQADIEVSTVFLDFETQFYEIPDIYERGLSTGMEISNEPNWVQLLQADFVPVGRSSWVFEFEGSCERSNLYMDEFLERLSNKTGENISDYIKASNCTRGAHIIKTQVINLDPSQPN